MPDTETKTSESPAEAAQLVLLDLRKLHFFRHGATLRLTVEEDRSHLKVSVLRAFPLSAPDRALSVPDAAHKEAGLLVAAAGTTQARRELCAGPPALDLSG